MSPVFAVLVADQLSWPGASYVHPYFTFPYLIMFFLVLVHFLPSASMRVPKRVAIWIVSIVALAFLSFSILHVDQVPRRFAPERDGLVALTEPATFENWSVAPQTQIVVERLRVMSEHCPHTTLFQIHWAPILYEITGRTNSTSFDLPYHDTLSLDDAQRLINELVSQPPGMIIVDPNVRDYRGPFPALGMHAVITFLDEQFLNSYRLETQVSDDFRTFEVYCNDSNS